MKALFGAAAVAALLVATPTLAQDFGSTTYINLGATNFALAEIEGEDIGDADFNLGAVTGRLGARFNNFFGVEGELGIGIRDQEESNGVSRFTTSLNYEVGAFLVGYLPVSPNAELFARVGVANTELEFEFEDGIDRIEGAGSETSVALGVGGQYFFDGVNGIRGDYTRYSADSSDFDALGVSYVRKF